VLLHNGSAIPVFVLDVSLFQSPQSIVYFSMSNRWLCGKKTRVRERLTLGTEVDLLIGVEMWSSSMRLLW